MARALIGRPKVLLLDESLGALDLRLCQQMLAVLTRLQRDLGITFINVTHDQGETLPMWRNSREGQGGQYGEDLFIGQPSAER